MRLVDSTLLARQGRQNGIDNEEHGEKNVVRDVEVTDFGPRTRVGKGKVNPSVQTIQHGLDA